MAKATKKLTQGQILTKTEEGYRSQPYIDSEGYWTVGYGELIFKRGRKFRASSEDLKAWGRRKTDKGKKQWNARVKTVFAGTNNPLTKKYYNVKESEHLKRFLKNYAKANKQAKKIVGKRAWNKMSSKWKDVVTDLTYQTGPGAEGSTEGLRGFKDMLSALREETPDVDKAAIALTASKRGEEQTPARAHRALQYLGKIPEKKMDKLERKTISMEEYDVVKARDTLSGIARDHRIPYDQFLRQNPQFNPENLIHPGQEYIIRRYTQKEPLRDVQRREVQAVLKQLRDDYQPKEAKVSLVKSNSASDAATSALMVPHRNATKQIDSGGVGTKKPVLTDADITKYIFGPNYVR